MNNYLKSHDVFGSPILLNYNRKDTYFKQVSGGFISFLLNSLVKAYVVYLVYELALNRNYQIRVGETSTDFAALG